MGTVEEVKSFRTNPLEWRKSYCRTLPSLQPFRMDDDVNHSGLYVNEGMNRLWLVVEIE